MFFDGAVNQNGNGVGSSPFLHACYLKARQKEPSPYSHSCQVEILLHKQTISQNILRVSQALRALELRIKEIDVYGDSSLIIFQTTGDWKTKDQKLIPYHQYLEDISLKFRRITFNYMSRTKNKFADALATLASMISRRYWYPANRIESTNRIEISVKKSHARTNQAQLNSSHIHKERKKDRQRF